MIKTTFSLLAFALATSAIAEPDSTAQEPEINTSEQCVALRAGYKDQLKRGDMFAAKYDPLIAAYDQAKEDLDKALASGEDTTELWEALQQARSAALPGVQGYGIVIRGIFAGARNAIEAHCIPPDGNPAKARATEAAILEEIAQKLAQMKAIPDDLEAYKPMPEDPPAP